MLELLLLIAGLTLALPGRSDAFLKALLVFNVLNR
jgi:hypothetical protein